MYTSYLRTKCSDGQNLTLSERFRKARDDSGKSVDDVAKETNVSKSRIYDLESGTSNDVGYQKIIALANCYNVSIDWLLTGAGVPSADTTLNFICQYTGLSESNVSFLHNPPEYFSDDPVSKYKESMYALANLLISCCKLPEVTESFQNLYIASKKELHATEDTWDIYVDTVRKRGFEILTGNDFIAFRAGKIAESIEKAIIERYRVEEHLYPTCEVIIDEHGDELYVE